MVSQVPLTASLTRRATLKGCLHIGGYGVACSRMSPTAVARLKPFQ